MAYNQKTEKPTLDLALPSSPNCKYDVFLSFGGEDTRRNFVGHLYAALVHKGIVTFKDSCGLERGKTISQELLRAIRNSRISIVVFSKTYASSAWCLDELAEIYECFKAGRQVVLPVFYDVEASEVRRQRGVYGEFFEGHEKARRRNKEEVQRWRAAMTEVASISGWDLQVIHESDAIQDIVEQILIKQRKSGNYQLSVAANNFVGMDSRVKELSLYFDIEQLNHVRIMGICGMGGIGKTTIARTVYERFSCKFEGSCFLANVREVYEKYGLVHLQEQLLSQILMEKSLRIRDTYDGTAYIRKRLSHKRVLIILDDVNQIEQLKSLAGARNWFGCGSRIIVTARDEHLLISHGVDGIYRVEGLNHDEAFDLFCFKAFKSNYCDDDDYMELANHFVDHANGLPLAIDILGSFLFGRSVNEWRSTLDRLKEIPNKEIMDKLYISFEGLDEIEKKIFLDIACFFKGEEEEYVKKVLRSCGFHPDIGIRVLIDKSLITISNGRIWMHDLLQDMAQEIVRRESYDEPGKRSRLWLFKDLSQIMLNDSGTEQVEGIVLDSREQESEQLSAKAFSKMRRLRLLKLQGLHLTHRLEFLSNELRYIEWNEYPFKHLPPTFQPVKLVELHMQYSKLQDMWKEMKVLKMLKVIDLRHSENLTTTMDFRQVPNLEHLNLEGCSRLSKLHETIGILKRLTFLNLKNCRSLVQLPDGICDLKSLKVLNLHSCSKLGKLPDRLGEISCLEKLIVGGVGGVQPPSAKPWDFLFCLRLFQWRNPNPLAFLLPSMSVLHSLKTLDLSDCHLTEGAIPHDLSCFPSLEALHLSGNDIVSIPSSIVQLSKLEDLRITNCKRLQSLPDLPSSILYLSLDGCTSLDTSLPKSISRHFEHKDLCVANCKRLQSQPDLSSCIIQLDFKGIASTEKFSNHFKEQSSKPSSLLTFVNHLNLHEIQGNIKCTTFIRLTCYLHYLLRHSRQGLFNQNSEVTMYLSGSEVPAWFNHQGNGCFLEFQLPPHWCTNKWMGFAICAIFRTKESPSETCNIACDLQVFNSTSNQTLFLGRPASQISKDMCNSSMRVWFSFVPRSSLSCSDWRDVQGQFTASFSSDQLEVKYCGVRIVYDTDINELLQCNKLYENLHVELEDKFNEDKRRRDGFELHDENDEIIEELNSKRLRML